MREILFRAKNKDDEWFYGYYVFERKRTGAFGQIITELDYDRHLIIEKNRSVCEINPETLGQYIGLKDKNGKKIFEGDILYDNFYKRNLLVKYVVEWGRYILDEIDDRDGNWLAFENVDFIEDIEIIGNIYNNPDLLGENK